LAPSTIALWAGLFQARGAEDSDGVRGSMAGTWGFVRVNLETKLLRIHASNMKPPKKVASSS
jgi:hypothetical protein